jgi:hypothetical protein
MWKIECEFNDCCAAAGWRQGMRRRPLAKQCWETNAGGAATNTIGIPLPAEPKTMVWSCALEVAAEGVPLQSDQTIPRKGLDRRLG